MSEPVNLFPADHIEALALEFASRYVGESVTPEYLCQKYWEAYYRIAAADSDAANAAKVKYRK